MLFICSYKILIFSPPDSQTVCLNVYLDHITEQRMGKFYKQ